MRYRSLKSFVGVLSEIEHSLATAPLADPHPYAEWTDDAQVSVLGLPWTRGDESFNPEYTTQIEAGCCVNIEDVGVLTINGIGGAGKRATVYRATDARGALYAIKIARVADDFNIVEEPRRLAYLDRCGVCPSPVVSSGRDYVLKEWIDGKVGNDWLSDNALARDEQVGLGEFMQRCALARVVVKDLKPRNMVLSTDRSWHCIDPGELTVGGTVLEAWAELKHYVLKHWCDVRAHHPRYIAARFL